MNPDTGEFHKDDGTLPEDWPRFTVGDRMTLGGCTFRIKRIDTELHELVLVHEKRFGLLDMVAARQDDEGIKRQLGKLQEVLSKEEQRRVLERLKEDIAEQQRPLVDLRDAVMKIKQEQKVSNFRCVVSGCQNIVANYGQTCPHTHSSSSSTD